MTICIGVLAADAKAIVCIADRYISYGIEILGETDSVKIVPIGENGTHVLISGNDDATSRILAKLSLRDDLGLKREQTKVSCENAYRESEEEVLEMRFLHPFLSRKEYKEALSKERVNQVVRSIAEEIRKDRETQSQPTFGCNVLLCGFDDKKQPYLIKLGGHGICTDATLTGFCAIGSGSGYALQRLLSMEWKRKYPIDRALFEMFDAKVQAENDINVGYDWDAVILTADKPVLVSEEIKTMIDRAWIKLNRSPYESFNPDEHVPLPPDDWMTKLKAFADTILDTP